MRSCRFMLYRQDKLFAPAVELDSHVESLIASNVHSCIYRLNVFAEVKALATGNPAVKEKMALDVDVAKLKLLKANHMNNQYRLEDDIARNFPVASALTSA